jgi:hypothetical protein
VPMLKVIMCMPCMCILSPGFFKLVAILFSRDEVRRSWTLLLKVCWISTWIYFTIISNPGHLTSEYITCSVLNGPAFRLDGGSVHAGLQARAISQIGKQN